MTCGTCHDPHDIPRGPKAVERYVAVCQSCHQGAHRSGTPRVSGVAAGATCLDCHMPKRRAEDAVHVVVTDHHIQRQRPSGNLLADRTEADGVRQGDYRGEVVLYYPPTLPPAPANELYVAVAQVQQGSNLTAGIRRLQQAIEQHRPARVEFYHELARAYTAAGDLDAGIRWSQEALRRDPSFVPALKQLASAATTKSNFVEAAQALEKALALRPADANAFRRSGKRVSAAGPGRSGVCDLAASARSRSRLPRTHNTMGLAVLRSGTAEAAESHFREAIRLQPDLAAGEHRDYWSPGPALPPGIQKNLARGKPLPPGIAKKLDGRLVGWLAGCLTMMVTNGSRRVRT